MHILILGGSRTHLGGVEAFCDRSKEAIERTCGGDWRISRIPTSTAYLSLKTLPGFLKGLAGLVGYSFKRPDVVWLQYVTLPDLVYLVLAKMLGCRVMVTPHLGSNWRSQSSPFLRAASGWMLGRANRLALISRTQELEINLPAHLPRSQIRNFLPPDILSSDLPEPVAAGTPMQLIHSGRLSEGKGTFLFVDVCAKLKAAGVPFMARITGGADKETYAKLDDMVAGYGLRDEVAVLRRVTDPRLLELLKLSDVLVHLSRIDSYPLIVLESTACCMFPIAMELAGARDMIETFGGKVVSDTQPVDETFAFLKQMNLDEIRAQSRVAAVAVRKEYAWDRCARAVEAALKATVAPASQSA